MFLPQQFDNDHSVMLATLSCLKLILSKDTLPDVVKYFYNDFFIKIEKENQYQDIYDYIETKSNDFFQNVGISLYFYGDLCNTHLDLTEDAYNYVFYEYYLSTLNCSEYDYNETICYKIEDELSNDFKDLLDAAILNSNMKYGDAAYESSFIMEIDLEKLILFLSELDSLITERMTLKPMKELAQNG